MKTDIILCGVGGQGILSIATIIGEAAMKENLYIKQAEVHGMSQRGGDVQSNLRISSNPIASDLIPLGGADVIISMEPMEDETGVISSGSDAETRMRRKTRPSTPKSWTERRCSTLQRKQSGQDMSWPSAANPFRETRSWDISTMTTESSSIRWTAPSELYLKAATETESSALTGT